MSKIVIDIDEDYYKIIQKNGGNNYLEDAVLNGIPLDDIKPNYGDGLYEGYRIATAKAEKCINDIKAELKEMADSYNWHYDAPRRDTLQYAILVIDQHIGKKEQ